MTRGEQQQQEGLNGQSKGGAEAEKSLMQLRQRSYQICWSQWEIECFFFCHLDGGRHGSAMSCASCCQQRSNTVWMREGNPQNKENRINGKQKKSQISIHPGGRDNPSTPQPAQGDWDCFGPLLWLMRRGEKKQESPARFLLCHFWLLLFILKMVLSRLLRKQIPASLYFNHSPYFLILAAVSCRQCYCQMLKVIRIWGRKRQSVARRMKTNY